MASKQQLYTIAKWRNAVRCGATDNPDERKYGYSRRYVGTMYCLPVENMHQEENQLLSLKDWRDNVQKVSNVGEMKGYVYVIVDEQ